LKEEEKAKKVEGKVEGKTEEVKTEVMNVYERKYSLPVRSKDGLPTGHPDPKGKETCPFNHTKIPFWVSLVASIGLACGVFAKHHWP